MGSLIDPISTCGNLFHVACDVVWSHLQSKLFYAALFTQMPSFKKDHVVLISLGPLLTNFEPVLSFDTGCCVHDVKERYCRL